MTDLSPNAELVRCLLTGVPVVGTQPAISELSDVELGMLARFAWGPRPEGAQVYEFLSVLRERTPHFDADSAVAALEALTESARQGAEPGERTVVKWMIEAAAQVVVGCPDAAQPAIQRALQNLLDLGMGTEPDIVGVALLSCTDRKVPEHPDELGHDEQAFMCELASLRDRVALAQVRAKWSFGVDDEELTPRGADPLALIPGYLAFAERLTAKALERTQGIQSGAIPYAADKAFSVDEAQVVRCALQAGLDQGKGWALEAAFPLLVGTSVAPKEKVKTVPSQSAAIAVAKAIAERPSARLVASMRSAVADVRHAGLKKKLARFQKTAERRLFEHDDFLLELDPDVKIPKALSTAVVRALEALFLRSSPVPFDLWKSRILSNKAISDRAAALVWREPDGTAILPVRKGRSWSFIGHDGQRRSPAAETVTLWHPLQPGVHADAWRALVLDREIQQPFNQVFRETYSETSIPNLLAPELDVKTLLGLARSQGWILRYGQLVRRLGPFRVELDVGRLYPGARGTTRCFALGLFQGSDQQRVDLASAEPQLVSECLRAVDLLVSVSAFSLDADCARETASARERRAALVGMLGSSSDSGRPFVDGRYVRAADLAISIATGRASRDGEEVRLPPTASGVAVIPYPDEILHRIVVGLSEWERGALRPG